MRLIKHFLLILPCLLLAACPNSDTVAEGSDAEFAANLFRRFPEPGEAVFHPPVPVFPPLGLDERNLLSDPDFEAGLAYWEVIGTSKNESAGFDGFSAAGAICCHALSSAHGDVFVHQVLDVMPATFYSFSALVFAPGDSEALAEVRSENGGAQVAGKSISGPMNAWSKVSLTFVTGRQTEKVRIGVSCRNGPERSPVWVDQARLWMAPVQNLFSQGAAEFMPDEEGEDLPEWFLNGKTAVPVSPGYQSAHSFAVPALGNRESRLYGLIYDYEQYAGRPLWISAMARIAGHDGLSAPESALTVQLTDAAGARTVISDGHSVAADWSEISFMAQMPAYEQIESSDPPPFQALVFALAEDSEGSVFLDEICIFPIPDGFDGGLVPPGGA